MTMEILEQYMFDADKAFEQQLYLEGKRYLENALSEDPTFGKAHNHMGWLYINHLGDTEKAEMHLKLALKYASNYSAPYIHMSYLLFDQARYDECRELLQKASYVADVPKSFIANEFGRLDEVQGNYRSAIRHYKMSIRYSLNEQEIAVAKDNIRRCKDKRWIFMF